MMSTGTPSQHHVSENQGRRSVRTAVAALLMLGTLCGLLCITPFSVVRAYVDRLAEDGSAEPYTLQLHKRLQVAVALCSFVLLVAAGALLVSREWFSRMARRTQSDAGRLGRELRVRCRHFVVALGVVTVLAVIVRMPYLGQPMRYDESYSYMNYVDRGIVFILATYDEPNNHVFHNLLVCLSTALLGGGPWAVRLPAFLAGMLVVPATMILTRTVAGRAAGVFAGLLIAASSPLIEYSTNARGYTICVLLTVVAWWLAVAAIRRDNIFAWMLLAIAFAVGAWTIPVMLYPAAMLMSWMLFVVWFGDADRRLRLVKRLCGMAATSAVLTLILYSPILLVNGTGSLVGNQFVVPVRMMSYLRGFVPAVQVTWNFLFRDVPTVVVVFLSVCFLVGCLSRDGSQRRSRALAIGSVLACLLLTAVQRLLPPERVWLFLLPLAAVLSAAGASQMLSSIRSSRSRTLAGGAMLAIAVVWPAVNTIRSESILRSRQGGVCVDAEQIVQNLAPMLRPNEPVLTANPVTLPVMYYASRHGVSEDHFRTINSYPPPIRYAVAIVSRTHPPATQTVQQVLDANDAPDHVRAKTFRQHRKYPSAIVYRHSP